MKVRDRVRAYRPSVKIWVIATAAAVVIAASTVTSIWAATRIPSSAAEEDGTEKSIDTEHPDLTTPGKPDTDEGDDQRTTPDFSAIQHRTVNREIEPAWNFDPVEPAADCKVPVDYDYTVFGDKEKITSSPAPNTPPPHAEDDNADYDGGGAASESDDEVWRLYRWKPKRARDLIGYDGEWLACLDPESPLPPAIPNEQIPTTQAVRAHLLAGCPSPIPSCRDAWIANPIRGNMRFNPLVGRPTTWWTTRPWNAYFDVEGFDNTLRLRIEAVRYVWRSPGGAGTWATTEPGSAESPIVDNLVFDRAGDFDFMLTVVFEGSYTTPGGFAATVDELTADTTRPIHVTEVRSIRTR